MPQVYFIPHDCLPLFYSARHCSAFFSNLLSHLFCLLPFFTVNFSLLPLSSTASLFNQSTLSSISSPVMGSNDDQLCQWLINENNQSSWMKPSHTFSFSMVSILPLGLHHLLLPLLRNCLALSTTPFQKKSHLFKQKSHEVGTDLLPIGAPNHVNWPKHSRDLEHL